MNQIIKPIETGDRAAIEIGIEVIQEDDYFVFGAILKSNTARALRPASLTVIFAIKRGVSGYLLGIAHFALSRRLHNGLDCYAWP